MVSEGLAACEWISGVLESAIYQDFEPTLHRRKSVCVVDAMTAFDPIVRELTGGHCRRIAQELCVIRRSMQTLRARCSRAEGCRRLDEEAREQCDDAAIAARWGPLNRV